MNTNLIHLKSSRIRLEPISREYVEDIFKEFTADITTYMNPKPAEKIEETYAFIDASREGNESGDMQMVIVNANTHEFLGCAGLHHIDSKTPELGIWVKKAAHGNKYGREAMTMLKNWADENLEYEYIIYPVVKENIASRRIPEYLGGKIHKEYEKVSQSGVTHDMVEYWISPRLNS